MTRPAYIPRRIPTPPSHAFFADQDLGTLSVLLGGECIDDRHWPLPPLVGSGWNPSTTCGRCLMPYVTTADRCPCCCCPEWLSQLEHKAVRWAARAKYRAACALGGEE